jgi:hypothetical protein
VRWNAQSMERYYRDAPKAGAAGEQGVAIGLHYRPSCTAAARREPLMGFRLRTSTRGPRSTTAPKAPHVCSPPGRAAGPDRWRQRDCLGWSLSCGGGLARRWETLWLLSVWPPPSICLHFPGPTGFPPSKSLSLLSVCGPPFLVK